MLAHQTVEEQDTITHNLRSTSREVVLQPCGVSSGSIQVYALTRWQDTWRVCLVANFLVLWFCTSVPVLVLNLKRPTKVQVYALTRWQDTWRVCLRRSTYTTSLVFSRSPTTIHRATCPFTKLHMLSLCLEWIFSSVGSIFSPSTPSMLIDLNTSNAAQSCGMGTMSRLAPPSAFWLRKHVLTVGDRPRPSTS